MGAMKNIPEIRIKGFEGEWKEKQLKDVCEVNPTTSVPDRFEYVDLESVVGTTMVKHRTEEKATAPSRAQRHAKYNDIFFQTVRPYQKNNYLFQKKEDNYVFSTGYAQLRANINPEYLFIILQSTSFVNQVLLNCTGSNYPAINPSALSNIDINITESDAEQQSLGSFFSSFDRLLSDHHRRLENLRRVKKSMLQKMFPQQGQTVPEIRFKGFSGEWEKAKLSTFLEVSEEKNSDNFYGIEDVLSVSGDYGVVNQIEFQGRSFAGASVAGYGVAETGDVIYTKSPLKSNPYGIIKTNKGKPGIVSVLYGVYHPIKGRTDSSFVQTYFESDARLNNYLRVLINKGSKNTLLISDEDALRGEVCFPSYEEQQRLSSFFTSLDNLINDEVNYIDQLTRVKSTLLQKMFV